MADIKDQEFDDLELDDFDFGDEANKENLPKLFEKKLSNGKDPVKAGL